MTQVSGCPFHIDYLSCTLLHVFCSCFSSRKYFISYFFFNLVFPSNKFVEMWPFYIYVYESSKFLLHLLFDLRSIEFRLTSFYSFKHFPNVCWSINLAFCCCSFPINFKIFRFLGSSVCFVLFL